MSLRIGGISNPSLHGCADAAFRQGARLHHRILKGERFQLHIAEGDSAQWLDGLGICTARAWSEAGWLANIYVVRFLISADEVAAGGRRSLIGTCEESVLLKRSSSCRDPAQIKF